MRRIEKLKRWNGLEDWELFDHLAWKTLKNQLKMFTKEKVEVMKII
jgi:hypothetical protein